MDDDRISLASQPFHRSVLLQQQTVNGFLYSRPYATEDCADLHNTILMEIWFRMACGRIAGAQRVV